MDQWENICPATGLERQESIFKTIEPFVNLRYYYYSAYTRYPCRMHEPNIETEVSKTEGKGW